MQDGTVFRSRGPARGSIRPLIIVAAAITWLGTPAGGGVATATEAVGAGSPPAVAAAKSPPFANPPQISSVDGVLDVTLRVEMAELTIRGKKVMTRVYNGLYVPPTLRVNPGDTIRITLVNGIDFTTNLHTHGMNVSPLNNGDNVFLHIEPGETFNYEIPVPADHPEGMFYYHPHEPGLTETQIMGGMSGLLVVEGILDPFPELAGITEQQLILKDTQIKKGELPDDIDPSAKTNRTLNGLKNPQIVMQPGETQLWRIANIGADLYYPLTLQGHTFYEIARDGNRHNQVIPREKIVLPPSSRVDVLVQANTSKKKAKKYKFKVQRYSTGPAGDQYPALKLATLLVQGDPVTPVALPDVFPTLQDLRAVPNPNQRTIVFSETADGNTFFVNGKMFDENRLDTTVPLGTVEKWTIKNCTREQHVFHIHQLDFQVVEDQGIQLPFVGYQDTVNVMIASKRGDPDPDCDAANAQISQQMCPGKKGQLVPCKPMTKNVGTPGTVKILVPFTNPIIEGQFVYHCHIGEHEDNGMMATIRVEDEGAPAMAGGGS